MKRNLSLIIIIIFSISTAWSQDGGKFKFGLSISPTYSWLSPDAKELTNNGGKVGFSYGLIADYYFTENYALSTGIQIDNSFGKLAYPSAGNTFFYVPDGDTAKFHLQSRNYKAQNLRIPLLLKLKTNEIGYLTYFGLFGVDAGFRLSAKADDTGVFEGSSTNTIVENVDVLSEVAFINIGLNLGIGAEYSLSSSTALVFSVNYHNGFSNSLKKQSDMLQDANANFLVQKAFLRYVGLNIGVLF